MRTTRQERRAELRRRHEVAVLNQRLEERARACMAITKGQHEAHNRDADEAFATVMQEWINQCGETEHLRNQLSAVRMEKASLEGFCRSRVQSYRRSMWMLAGLLILVLTVCAKLIR